MNVVIYARARHQSRRTETALLRHQLCLLRVHARCHGLKVVAELCDRGSVGSARRPGLRKALEHIQRGTGSAILVTALDRLVRRLDGWADFHRIVPGRRLRVIVPSRINIQRELHARARVAEDAAGKGGV